MSSFIIETQHKETVSTAVVDVTLSGGAYSINIDNIYYGTMVKDDTSPLGYSTTDKVLLPHLEHIAYQLKNRKKHISISELFTALVGIVQLMFFLLGTIITFRLKEKLQKAKVFILVNLLPFLLESSVSSV